MTRPTRRGLAKAAALAPLAPALAPALAAGLAARPAAAQDRPHPRLAQYGAAFPFESRFVEAGGARLHHVDEGAGAPVVFLHGNPTSSYLWRNVLPHVRAEGRRLIAPDLPGFGRSTAPPGMAWTFQEHYAVLEAFVDALELTDLTFVLHDWGSVLGLLYAARRPDRVRAVAFLEAIVPPAFPMESLAAMGPYAETFRAFRDPAEGRALIVEQNAFVEQLLPAAVLRPLEPEEMAAYRAPFREPASREPVLVWPNELPIAGEPARNVAAVEEVGAWLRASETPKLLLYASPGALVPPEAAAWMAANYRNIQTRFVGYGVHYLQEDEPEAIGRNVADWMRGLGA